MQSPIQFPKQTHTKEINFSFAFRHYVCVCSPFLLRRNIALYEKNNFIILSSKIATAPT